MLCRNKACTKSNGKRAKLPKTAFPPVCDDECKKASGQQAIAKSNAAAERAKRRAENTKARAEKEARKALRLPAKKRLKSIAKLVDEAAVLLQRLVRMKAADDSGMCKSFTSNKVLHWTEMQGSHFIQRNRLATKLLEENVHPQTPGENMYDMKTATGVLDYRRAMVDFYGEEFVQWLEMESKKVKKYTRHEAEGIIFEFKRQIQEQEHRLSGAIQQKEGKAA